MSEWWDTGVVRRFALTAVLAALVLVGTATSGQAAVVPVVAWEMNEPAGATVMTDSSPSGITGTIGTEVVTGAVYQGATGYRFARLTPSTPPAHPEHVVVVPDTPALDPGTAAQFEVVVRYRTTHKFGNLIQKGQATAPGGQWKIQLPQGNVSCLFKGPSTSNAVRSTVNYADGAWHTLRCLATPTQVSLWVDGVLIGRNNGTTGQIANASVLSIAGKTNCDQIKITCDYFAGEIDYVRIGRS